VILSLSAGRGSSFVSTPAFARIAPFALFIAWLAAQSALEQAGLVGDFADRWLVALRGVAVAALLLFFRQRYTELGPATAVRARDALAAVLVGWLVFAAWLALDRGWAAWPHGPGFAPFDAHGRFDPALAIVRFAGFAFAVPVMEELFWRSFLMRWIRRRDFLEVEPRQTGWVAFALCSALFASEHSLWLAGLAAGLAYGGLYLRTGNLWIPILSHATTNGTLGLWILAAGEWRYW
jgi:CAAX prenyl protease-like protein